MKTGVFDVTTEDGYKATMTVRWHKRQIVERSALIEGCEAILTANRVTPSERTVYYAATAEVSMEFPESGGFSWPEGERISVSISDGKDTQYWDRATTCYDGQDMDSPAALGQFTLSPESPSTTVMWMETAERTPKNPNGKIETDPTYELSPRTDLTGKCVKRGSGDDGSRACFARYGS